MLAQHLAINRALVFLFKPRSSGFIFRDWSYGGSWNGNRIIVSIAIDAIRL